MTASTKTPSRIKILDETLINKIAAGEVIERPSSVVKELIENSLDAHAKNISIELEEGGLKLVAVHDDGRGMVGDDLELAFTRHATSKISKTEDLFNIHSFGFRGEALPSIASVAQVRAVSRFYKHDSGSEMVIEGGKFINIKAAGSPPGTSIIVSNLFYNTPARRKFIKSPRSEMIRISEMVTSYAIGSFKVGFKLVHNNRELFNYPAGQSLLDRLASVYGIDNRAYFLPLPGTGEDGFNLPGTVLGYISHPDFARPKTGEVRFYVNFRPIQSPTLLAAYRQAYGDMMTSRYYPPAAIFFSMLPRDIDVNVHPAKTEIRFKNESELFVTLKRIIEHALKTAGAVTSLELRSDRETPYKSGYQMHDSYQRGIPPQHDFSEALLAGGFQTAEKGIDAPAEGVSGIPLPENTVDGREIYSDRTRPRMWQFKNSFIMVPLKEAILFIDQHNAHERILYEEAISRLERGKGFTQQLLFPVTVDLTPVEFTCWNRMADIFRKLGFEISEFGGTSIIINGIPAGMDDSSPDKAIREMLDDFPRIEELKEDLHKSVAASYACRAAIKAGEELSPEEMNLLCDKLFACRNFNYCPHGRPIIARLTVGEIENKFKRNIPIR
jgi:DNA mismatch repair protein MutL